MKCTTREQSTDSIGHEVVLTDYSTEIIEYSILSASKTTHQNIIIMRCSIFFITDFHSKSFFLHSLSSANSVGKSFLLLLHGVYELLYYIEMSVFTTTNTLRSSTSFKAPRSSTCQLVHTRNRRWKRALFYCRLYVGVQH